MELSVVIPAYNEAKRLGTTLKAITYTLKHPEIIVVDDGSNDDTYAIAKHYGAKVIRFEQNRGKGAAVKAGMLAATKQWVLFTDADLSTPLNQLAKLLKYTNYDLIIGSRALKESDIKKHQPFYREYSGKLFNVLVQLLAVPGIGDTQCGFKLFKKETVMPIFSRQTINGFGFDVEIIFIAKKLGYKIKEVPVVWLNNTETKVKLVFDSLCMFNDLLKIRINQFRGRYD